jgi:glutaryl-CoA dehydrogenase
MSVQLLAPAGDFYDLELLLPDEDRRLLADLREFLRAEVAPIINDYWRREEFPHQIVPPLAELGVAGLSYEGFGCPGRGTLLDGMATMEVAAADSSIATFLGVHGHLAMG